MYDKMPIYGLHKLYGAQSAVKIREGDGYTIFATKKKRDNSKNNGGLKGENVGDEKLRIKSMVLCL